VSAASRIWRTSPRRTMNDSTGAVITAGRKQGELTKGARMICVADICDALRQARPYREGLSVERTLEVMTRDAGTGIDSDCVGALEAALTSASAPVNAAAGPDRPRAGRGLSPSGVTNDPSITRRPLLDERNCRVLHEKQPALEDPGPLTRGRSGARQSRRCTVAGSEAGRVLKT